MSLRYWYIMNEKFCKGSDKAMQRWNYDSLIQAAEQGDPCKMLEVAKLYKAGAFGDSDHSEYLFWLKRFFESPKVNAILLELEDKYSGGDSPYSHYFDMESSSLEEYYVLCDSIVEAGLALGIYYSNSSKKENLELSRDSLVAALDASRWDYLTYDDPNGVEESILSLLGKVNDRIKKLGYQAGEDNE